jgi:hypothetical protein
MASPFYAQALLRYCTVYGDVRQQVNSMPKKTQGIEKLVSEVLETIPRPYGEDVIEDVFLAIERQPTWQSRYDVLVLELDKDTVNQWVGRYTKNLSVNNLINSFLS